MIAAACRDSECLRFAYRSRDGTDTRREVEPHALVNFGRRWYLVAWDRRREDWRTFRVDRLARPASTGVRFAPRELPAKDAAAYVNAEHRRGAAPLRGPRDPARPGRRARRPRPCHWGTVEPIDDRTLRVPDRRRRPDWLALRVAMLRVDFEVHEPPELIEHLQALAVRLRRATSGGNAA